MLELGISNQNRCPKGGPKNEILGWASWPCGNARWLMFKRSPVRIPTPYTSLTFFTFICCKNCNVCLKRQNKRKRGQGWPHYLRKRGLEWPVQNRHSGGNSWREIIFILWKVIIIDVARNTTDGTSSFFSNFENDFKNGRCEERQMRHEWQTVKAGKKGRTR